MDGQKGKSLKAMEKGSTLTLSFLQCIFCVIEASLIDASCSSPKLIITALATALSAFPLISNMNSYPRFLMIVYTE